MNSLLKEISEWKLEAKLEDTSRYFYHMSEVDRVEDGSRAYVIGRKGSGKTAISEYIVNAKRSGWSSFKMSFKNFPFNDLYALKDDNYTAPNQYNTIWEYLIYSAVARMLLAGTKLSQDARSVLSPIFEPEPQETLSRTISRWTSGGAKIAAGVSHGPSVSLEGNAARTITSTSPEWSERLRAIKQLLMKHLTGDHDHRFFIVFDELDEDYKDMLEPARRNQYTHLLTGLFKACQSVKYDKFARNAGIRPVVFLRDDIYDVIQDSDKNKWSDLRIDLEWTEDRIRKLLAFRISKAATQHGGVLQFDKALHQIFGENLVLPAIGNRRRHTMHVFNFISRSTHLRPRDYIKYLQTCAADSIERSRTFINPKTLLAVDNSFSVYLRDELVDEMHGVLPNVKDVFGIISQIRRQQFQLADFEVVYKQYVERAMITDARLADPRRVMEFLFYFSVVGNQPRQRNVSFFRYKNRDAQVNFREAFVVHRGLFKAFQIV